GRKYRQPAPDRSSSRFRVGRLLLRECRTPDGARCALARRACGGEKTTRRVNLALAMPRSTGDAGAALAAVDRPVCGRYGPARGRRASEPPGWGVAKW